MSDSVSAPGVKTGIWTNYDHGKIQGATLTISTRQGGLLIAFLALYVSVTGTRFWAIIRFILHQLNTQRGARSVFYAQQQLILRNSGEALNTAYGLFQIIWAWKGVVPNPLARSLHFILLAFLVLAITLIGGIFSSEVSKASGSSILVQSKQCGVLAQTGTSLSIESGAFNFMRQVASAWSYARACYGAQTNGLQCSLYVKQQLNWTSNANATCPFDEDICIFNGTQSLQLDTGLIDSHTDLGLNSAPKNRISYRKVTTCAPIHTEPFTSLRNSTSVETPPIFQTFNNSNVLDGNWKIHGPFQDFFYGAPGTQTTYSYNLQDWYNNYGYEIVTRSTTTDDWTLIPPLDRKDADTSLYFLSSNILEYLSPIDDPWFSAHVPINTTGLPTPETGYSSDAFVQVLACTEQYQFCNPSTGRCFPLAGLYSAMTQIQDLGLNKYQNQTATLIIDYAAEDYTLDLLVTALGVDALLASSQLIGLGISAPLPNNQWQTEVTSWFSIGLAVLQQIFVEYATGPSPDHVMPNTSTNLTTMGDPGSPVTRAICNNQKIKSNGDYQNFSVLGLCCILGIGGIIILASLLMECLLGTVHEKMKRGREGRIRWMADSNFQVQRMMYESHGYEKWKGHIDTIPVYSGGEDLEFPVELEDGTFGLPKRRAMEQMEEASDEKHKEAMTVDIEEVSSRSGNEISVEDVAGEAK